MNFIENILGRLAKNPKAVVLREVRDGQFLDATGEELLTLVRQARTYIRQSGLRVGDRCGLLAANSIRWVATDLALTAEGVIVIPLYARQAPAELVTMLKDAGATMALCGDEALRDGLAQNWPGDTPPIHLRLFYDLFDATTPDRKISDEPLVRSDQDVVKIIYTSGTSGEAKGVMITTGNVSFMLGCTGERLDQLMAGQSPTTPDRVFHYLPFCFAGSWILLLSCLSRNSVLSLSTDLSKLADELKAASPNYCLNVPTLLERIREGVEKQIAEKPGFVQTIYKKGKSSWMDRYEGKSPGLFWFPLANWLIFSSIKKKIGPDIKALICGSAPLARETQLYFSMLGIRVLQVYGLTETTAICTMDDPRDFTPGRVGPAIPGVEMKLGEGNEILVRGPNIFPGYWNREIDATNGDWFHTGDQGEVDEKGNWAIIGRVKNLIILNSGHNIAPEPIEEKLHLNLPGAQQCVVMGNGRGYLIALITGDLSASQVDAAIAVVNPTLPHYKQIHAYHLHKDPLTIESGLLTANGKLRRDAIAAQFRNEFDDLYRAAKH